MAIPGQYCHIYVSGSMTQNTWDNDPSLNQCVRTTEFAVFLPLMVPQIPSPSDGPIMIVVAVSDA